MQTLLYNATLVLPDMLIENGWLLIEDSSILDLGVMSMCPGVQAGAIDCGGNYLLPGLIDLHCDATL